MELVEYIRLLRRRWYLIVLTLIAGAAGAAFATHQQTAIYSSSTTFYVSDNGKPISVLQSTNAQSRIATYSSLAESPTVVNEAIASVTGSAPGNVSVTADEVSNTIFMKITVDADSASGAYQVASAYDRLFPPYVSNFERSKVPNTGTSVRVIDAATPRSDQISPSLTRNLLIGLGLGLVVGICGLLVAETLDVRLRSGEDIERFTGLSLLATVPVEHRNQPLVTATKPRSQRAEAIRQLRTNLQFASVDKELRSIVVCSALADEGKTSISANLAMVFAALGKKVILLDADLRKPSVADIMGVDGSVGLTNVLTGAVTVESALVAGSATTNLLVLPAGTRPANPSELLASQKMAETFKRLTAAADIVIVDTPPLLPVTDAAILGAMSDGFVLVTRMNGTSKYKVRAAAEQAAKLNLPVLGIVANWAPLGSRDGYYRETGRRRHGKDNLLEAAPVAATPPRRATRRTAANAPAAEPDATPASRAPAKTTSRASRARASE